MIHDMEGAVTSSVEILRLFDSPERGATWKTLSNSLDPPLQGTLVTVTHCFAAVQKTFKSAKVKGKQSDVHNATSGVNMCKWVHKLRSVTALIGLFLNGEAEHIWGESFWRVSGVLLIALQRLETTSNPTKSDEPDPFVLDLVRKRKWCVSDCFVNTYRDFVRAKLNEDMLKYVEHCNERIHGFRMVSGQRSRAKLRTCQDSAAIPAFDESRTETLTTCHDMLRCTTTSSNVELIELNKLRLRQSTRIYDWHGVPPTSCFRAFRKKDDSLWSSSVANTCTKKRKDAISDRALANLQFRQLPGKI